jgi:serine/threonine protein phosphatase 1
VVETLRQGPPNEPRWSGFSWVCLRGNHEEALLRFLADALAGPTWLANGGMAAIDSYAGPQRDAHDLLSLQEALQRGLPGEHRSWLESLPHSHAEGDYFFAHAGVRPGVPLHRQDPMDLMWIRREFLDSAAEFGKVVVHGHTVTDQPVQRHNRIGIDTGAYRSGRLTALVAEGAERGFLSS